MQKCNLLENAYINEKQALNESAYKLYCDYERGDTMKLLFQSDDYGFSEAITLGIIKGIKEGCIRNTGMFVNMPASSYAASMIKDYPECCFGIDINLVAGKSVSNPNEIPNLVDEHGYFISSSKRKITIDLESNKEDPYPYEEVLKETRAQVERFIELTGVKPGYIHPHSVMTANIVKALATVADEYAMPFSMKFLKSMNAHFVTNDWNPRPVFTLEQQKNTNVLENTLRVLPEVLDNDLSVMICHAGFIDSTVLDFSSYSIIRTRDLEMATSSEVKEYIEKNNIELVTYRDLV